MIVLSRPRQSPTLGERFCLPTSPCDPFSQNPEPPTYLNALLSAFHLLALADARSLSPKKCPLAISACYLFRAIGQVIGVAIAAAIQQSLLLSSLLKRLPTSSPELIHSIIQEPARVIPMLDAGVQLEAKLAYLTSIRGVFGFVIGGGVLLSMVCLGIRARPL